MIGSNLVVNQLWLPFMTDGRDPGLLALASRARQVVDKCGSIAEAPRRFGMPVNTVSRLVNGANEPGLFVAATFASKAGVSLDWLLGQSDDPAELAIGRIPDQALAREAVSIEDRRLAWMRMKIAEALGGRAGALRFERENGAFQRKTLQSWIDGKTTPDMAELMAFAKAVERPLDFFLPDREPPPSVPFVMIPVVDARAAAGIGRIPDQAIVREAVPFARRFLERLGASPNSVSALRATGDSMAPTITDGALMFIDESQRILPAARKRSRKSRDRAAPDPIYVFFHSDDGMRIKRLRRIAVGDKECLAIISDNFAAHPPEILPPDEVGYFKILGKVIWWDNRL